MKNRLSVLVATVVVLSFTLIDFDTLYQILGVAWKGGIALLT